jgi:hypothetical protein
MSDVLGRGVSMDWFEGVALVRGVAERLIETSGEVPLVPELHEIEISESGRVAVTGRAIAGGPVRHLGQLLQATLGHTQVPVQLRLLIVQATAPSPAFASIREFDEALAYFERPGRDTILQALYVRAAAAPPSGFVLPPTLDMVAPLPAPDAPANVPKRTKAKRRSGGLKVAVATIALFVCVAATWYITRRGVTVGRRDASAIARQVADAVGAAALSGLSAVTERTGLGRLVPAGAPGSKPPAAPASDIASAKQSGVKPTVPTPDAPAEPLDQFDFDASKHYRVGAPAPAGRVAEPSGGLVAEATEQGGGPIFSRDSEGVSPPEGVGPQLPRELPPNVRPEQLCGVELIVSETGTVESVKLLRTPRSVLDSMLLSAAKAWRFRPALKDGRPVKFRKIVWMLSE